MRQLLLLILSGFIFSSTAFAAEQVITLKDGSQIKGELAGIADGTYTIKTPIIGDVHVAAGDVVSIVSASAMPANVPNAQSDTTPGTPAVANPALSQQIQSAQKDLLNNPQAMMDLQKLGQDPEIMKLLSDPTLVQAVSSQNIDAIQNNPKAQELINNPKMRELMKKLQDQTKHE